MRREKVLKAGKLAESWKFLEENSEDWHARTREETARIREEEKLERLEIVKQKRKRAQKGFLTKEETRKLK